MSAFFAILGLFVVVLACLYTGFVFGWIVRGQHQNTTPDSESFNYHRYKL